MSNLPPSVELTKAVVDIAQGAMTTVAIVVGAIWAYFKVLKGRVYTRRLEPALEGTMVMGSSHKLLVVRLAIKNVGLFLGHGCSSFCTVTGVPPGGPVLLDAVLCATSPGVMMATALHTIASLGDWRFRSSSRLSVTTTPNRSSFGNASR